MCVGLGGVRLGVWDEQIIHCVVMGDPRARGPANHMHAAGLSRQPTTAHSHCFRSTVCRQATELAAHKALLLLTMSRHAVL